MTQDLRFRARNFPQTRRAAGLLALLSLPALPASAWAPSFTEAFDGPGVGANLQDPDAGYTVAGGVIRRTSSAGSGDRHYVRTIRTDYNTFDWTYTIDFNLAGDDIVFKVCSRACEQPLKKLVPPALRKLFRT